MSSAGLKKMTLIMSRDVIMVISAIENRNVEFGRCGCSSQAVGSNERHCRDASWEMCVCFFLNQTHTRAEDPGYLGFCCINFIRFVHFFYGMHSKQLVSVCSGNKHTYSRLLVLLRKILREISERLMVILLTNDVASCGYDHWEITKVAASVL